MTTRQDLGDNPHIVHVDAIDEGVEEGWYWEDETNNYNGPYATKEEAEQVFTGYCEALMTPRKHQERTIDFRDSSRGELAGKMIVDCWNEEGGMASILMFSDGSKLRLEPGHGVVMTLIIE